MHTYLCSFLWIKPILMIRNEVRVAAACRWRETRVLCQKAKRDDDPPSRVVIKRIIKRILSAIRSSGRSIVFGRSFVRSIGWATARGETANMCATRRELRIRSRGKGKQRLTPIVLHVERLVDRQDSVDSPFVYT